VTPLAVLLLPGAVLAVLPHMSRASGLRAALMRSVLVVALSLAVMTELLSLVDGLRPVVVAVAWGLFILAGGALAMVDKGEGNGWLLMWRWARQRLLRGARSLVETPSVALMSLGVLVTLGTIVTIALASPPNNWDSMSYHLPRVMHWAADHNVRYFDTSIDRQLYSGPFAEYVILHVYLLTGSDWLFNSVQWAALAGDAVMVSLIARQLGGGRRAQALAAVVAVTIPMAILQASSTQNDLVEALFLLLVVHAALDFRSLGRPRLVDAWPLGAALGVALLAKSTGYLLAAPFVVLALSSRLRSLRVLLGPLALVAGLVVVVNIGQAARNEGEFGSFVGPASAHVLVNTHFSPAVTVVNSLRLFGSAATTSHASFNAHLLGLVDRGSKAVGVNKPDEGTIYGATSYSVGWSLGEDYASFPIDALAICLVLLLTALRVPPLRGLRAGYVGASVVAFLLFASYLRWQPWSNRLDMPLAMVWAPLIAVAIAAWHRYLALPAAVVFAWLAPTFLLHNASRPLEGPVTVFNASQQQLIFWNRGTDIAPYNAATQIIQQHHAKVVGLIEGADDWEYPLWRMNGGALKGTRFVDIRVADLHGKPAPHYDLAMCTDPIVASCAALNRPGWTVSQLGGGMEIATPS
jgi:hypothetical protein